MVTHDIAVAVRSADPLTRAGAQSYLRQTPGIEVVDPPHPPGRETVVLVLTQRLDEMTDAELRRLAREPGRRVVLVADRLREPELLAVLEYGVRAIVWRADATPSRLERAIRAAARGESQLPLDLLGQLVANVSRTGRAAMCESSVAVPTVGLTPREIDVLRLLADGLNTRQIADKLSYSERTIKGVLSGLTTRMQLRNRVHAVAYALREGYI
jgi:DNA-binding NarL/FixJ family response regulator